MYPNGVGDAQGKFVSAFLRPVKNDIEIALSNWKRPISHFAFRLKRITPAEEIDEFGNTLIIEDYVTHFSESDFQEFSEETPGTFL